MNNIILEFLEAYKSLDELCKQILSSDRGVSEYIDEMSHESPEYRIYVCWEQDYKQLKRMRWIRNRLVHEADSFQDNLVNVKDIEWLQTFYQRIIECTDSLSLLQQSRDTKGKKVKQEEQPENYFSTIEQFPSQNQELEVNWIGIILLGIVILSIIFFF